MEEWGGGGKRMRIRRGGRELEGTRRFGGGGNSLKEIDFTISLVNMKCNELINNVPHIFMKLM